MQRRTPDEALGPTTPEPSETPDGWWVFGYGSLIWRPAFPYVDRRPGFVRGFVRRFWQASTDHRGVPEAPGRVVTLIPDPEAICWGTAYRVAPEHRDEVIALLDVREQGGYAQHRVDVWFEAERSLPAVTYVAGPDNSNYVGPTAVEDIVAIVRRSRGPSGPNDEYVLRLAEALREIGAVDEHVFELESRLRGD